MRLLYHSERELKDEELKTEVSESCGKPSIALISLYA
jgi:hypothetical protein